MNKVTKALLPLVIILIIVAVGLQMVKWKLNSGGASRQGSPQAQGIQVGASLPNFDLHTLDGKSLKLSDLGSKVTLLNFWATWCEACMVEMPSIIKLNGMYKDKGLAIVAINLDDKPEAVVPKTVRQLKIDFPIYTDNDGMLANLFDVHAIPLTVIIDKDRKILHIEGGERDWTDSDIKTKMNQWLGI